MFFFNNEKVWCGPPNCLENTKHSQNLIQCAEGQTCVIQTDRLCFSPPCIPFGQCQDLELTLNPVPYYIDSKCSSHKSSLSTTCAKISLLFDKSKTPAVSLNSLKSFEEEWTKKKNVFNASKMPNR